VEFAERDRYWVDDGKVGWLDRSRVIPADQKAIARLTQMIKADLQHGRLVRARSSVWIVLGEPDKALADCNRAIELNPKDAAPTAPGAGFGASRNRTIERLPTSISAFA